MASYRERIHPAVPEALEALQQGRISRREFLRVATLLGLSVPTTFSLAACAPTTPAAESPKPSGASAAAAPASTPGVAAVPASTAIKRGGTLRVGMQVQAMDDPARLAWVTQSNIAREVGDYLAETLADNITRPSLLQKWEASDDLKTWTLYLRPDVKWSNGDSLTTDDVVFNFKRWLDPNVGSSVLGLFKGFLTANDIEVKDPKTVILHLAKPKLDVPENLYHYPAMIMHRSFNGDITSPKNPTTGPFTIQSFEAGQRCRLVRRDGYWQQGTDGKPLPYVDAIEFTDLGDDKTPYATALLDGKLDTFYSPSAENFKELKGNSKVNFYSVTSGEANVIRMRADQDPWKDNRVRTALKLCQRRQAMLDQAYFGEGKIGTDSHVSPAQPEYYPIEPAQYDPAKAKQLLADAGFPNGIQVSLAVGNLWSDHLTMAQALQEDAKAAGFDIKIDTMPGTAYNGIWTQTNFGITLWTHRPLAVMLLAVAYTADDSGNPVPWNETHWVDKEFNELLTKAQGTLDVEARKQQMQKIEQIMIDRGPVGTPFFKNKWAVAAKTVQGLTAHPSGYNFFRQVWIDPSKA